MHCNYVNDNLFIKKCLLNLIVCSYPVSCMARSVSGLYLATGETGRLGVRAKTIVWDTASWTQVIWCIIK